MPNRLPSARQPDGETENKGSSRPSEHSPTSSEPPNPFEESSTAYYSSGDHPWGSPPPSTGSSPQNLSYYSARLGHDFGKIPPLPAPKHYPTSSNGENFPMGDKERYATRPTTMRGKGSAQPEHPYQNGYLAPPGRSLPRRGRNDAHVETSGFDSEPESTQDEKAPVEYEAYNDELYVSDISEGVYKWIGNLKFRRPCARRRRSDTAIAATDSTAGENIILYLW